MTDFHDWEELRAELHDGDDAALMAERARTEAWTSAFHQAEECGRSTSRPVDQEVPDLLQGGLRGVRRA
jgi:hypothetical protein